MTCAACSTRLEKVLNRLPGVEARVNLAAEKARLRFTPGIASLDTVLAPSRKPVFPPRRSPKPAAPRRRRARQRNITMNCAFS
jgi:P-type Cu+ transporter